MACEYCTDPNGDPCCPWYGKAPHTHGEEIGHGIIVTATLPREEWPDTFVEDPDEPGMGTYYCPHCREGMPA